MRFSSALLALALLAAPEAAAQVGFDFTLGPVVSWTDDAAVFAFDPNDPDFNPGTIEEGAFEDLDLQPTVGFEAGLGLLIVPKNVGVRLGVHYLNTSAVLDDEGRSFDRSAFEANFVTLQADLRAGTSLGPARAYVFGGPEFRFLVDLSDEDVTFASVREEAELLSTAATFGAGITLNLFGTKVGPRVSYSLGLSGVESGDVIVESDTGGLEALRFRDGYNLDTLLFGIVLGGR